MEGSFDIVKSKKAPVVGPEWQGRVAMTTKVLEIKMLSPLTHLHLQ